MSSATLLIAVEGGADARRAFGQITGEHRRANDAMGAAERRGAADHARAEARRLADTRRSLAEQVRAEQLAQRDRTRADERAQRAKERSEKAATAVAHAEARARKAASDAEAREAIEDSHRLLRARMTDARRATAVARREAAERTQVATREASARSGLARAAADAAFGAAGQYSGAIQDVRQRRAQQAAPLMDLFRGGGFTGGESVAVRAQFFEAARRMDLDPAALAQAAAHQQETFSTFSGDTAAARAHNVQRFLSQAERARHTVGEGGLDQYFQAAGLAAQIGGSDEEQQRLTDATVRLGEMGSVEQRQVVAEAMGPLMRQVGAAQGALGPSATTAQRTEAGRAAFLQGMAEMEAMRGIAGYSPGNEGGVTAAMNRALTGTRTQDAMRSNILHTPGVGTAAERARIEAALYENDPSQHGHRRLRAQFQSVNALGQQLDALTGGNQTLVGNMFAGSGQGNRMGLQANWRQLLTAGMTRDEHGESGWQRANRFVAEARTGFSAEEVQRRAGLTAADPATQLRHVQNEHDAALGDNTSAVNRLSNAITDFLGSHPAASAALGAASGLLPGLINAGGGPAAAAAAGGAAPGGVAGALGGLSSAATTATAAVGAFAAGLGIGGVLNDAGRALTGRPADSIDRQGVGGGVAELAGNLGEATGIRDPARTAESDAAIQRIPQAVRDAVLQGLTGVQLQAVLSAHDVAYVNGGLVSAPNRTPAP